MSEYDHLIVIARQSRENAHAPYSNFRVGAALRAVSGRVFGGCNVENATYGLTVCAERTAIFKAISDGERGFDAISVVTDTDTLTPKVNLCITNTDNAPLNPIKTQSAGNKVTYTIKAFNTTGCSTATPASGPSSAPAAIITDNFPALLTACTWTCTGSGGGRFRSHG